MEVVKFEIVGGNFIDTPSAPCEYIMISAVRA